MDIQRVDTGRSERFCGGGAGAGRAGQWQSREQAWERGEEMLWVVVTA